MQRRHCIGAPREPQCQHRHTKQFVRIVGILAAQSHQAFLGESQGLAKRPDVLLDQTGIETVVPGWYWSMRGEHHFARHSRHRRVKRDAFLLHPHANRFQHRKCAVPFVQVKNAGRNSQSFESAQSAHAQQQLLTNADAEVAAVQPRR